MASIMRGTVEIETSQPTEHGINNAGHYGNELADKLAKEAAKNSDIRYNKIHPPKKKVKYRIKKEIGV